MLGARHEGDAERQRGAKRHRQPAQKQHGRRVRRHTRDARGNRERCREGGLRGIPPRRTDSRRARCVCPRPFCPGAGGARDQASENAPHRLVHLHGTLILPVHGPHVRMAAPRSLSGPREHDDVRAHGAVAPVAGPVRQLQVLPKRLLVPRAPLPQHGLARRARVCRIHRLWHRGDVPHELFPRPWRPRGCARGGHGSVFRVRGDDPHARDARQVLRGARKGQDDRRHQQPHGPCPQDRHAHR